MNAERLKTLAYWPPSESGPIVPFAVAELLAVRADGLERALAHLREHAYGVADDVVGEVLVEDAGRELSLEAYVAGVLAEHGEPM